MRGEPAREGDKNNNPYYLHSILQQSPSSFNLSYLQLLLVVTCSTDRLNVGPSNNNWFPVLPDVATKPQ